LVNPPPTLKVDRRPGWGFGDDLEETPIKPREAPHLAALRGLLAQAWASCLREGQDGAYYMAKIWQEKKKAAVTYVSPSGNEERAKRSPLRIF
jgi:hypothetical protein